MSFWTDGRARRDPRARVGRLTLLGSLLIVALILGACSGGSSAKTAKKTTNKKAAANVDRPDSRFCVLLNEIDQLGRSVEPSDIGRSYGELAEKAEQLPDVAPDDLKDQVADFVSAMKKITAAMEAADWDVRSFDMTKVEGLDQKKFQASSEALTQFRQKNCVQTDDAQTDNSEPGETLPPDDQPSD